MHFSFQAFIKQGLTIAHGSNPGGKDVQSDLPFSTDKTSVADYQDGTCEVWTIVALRLI